MYRGDCDYDDELWEKRENCIKILSYKIVYRDCTREEKVIGYYSSQGQLNQHAAWFEEYSKNNVDYFTLELSETVIPLDTIRRLPSNPKMFDPNKIDHAMRMAQNKLRQRRIDQDKAEIEFSLSQYKKKREILTDETLSEEERKAVIKDLSERKKIIIEMMKLSEKMEELHVSILGSDHGVLREIRTENEDAEQGQGETGYS